MGKKAPAFIIHSADPPQSDEKRHGPKKRLAQSSDVHPLPQDADGVNYAQVGLSWCALQLEEASGATGEWVSGVSTCGRLVRLSACGARERVSPQMSAETWKTMNRKMKR